jgi:cyanophycinase-like exopeptidase
VAQNASSRTRTFLLMGSGEFEQWSNEIEAAALDGRTGHVAVLPTASSAEGEDVFGRWGSMALEHYASVGIEARLVPVRTREDAEREDHARELEGAAMIFFSGGKPQHLADTIHGTKLWHRSRTRSMPARSSPGAALEPSSRVSRAISGANAVSEPVGSSGWGSCRTSRSGCTGTR